MTLCSHLEMLKHAFVEVYKKLRFLSDKILNPHILGHRQGELRSSNEFSLNFHRSM